MGLLALGPVLLPGGIRAIPISSNAMTFCKNQLTGNLSTIVLYL
jgi:hypothetical protein